MNITLKKGGLLLLLVIIYSFLGWFFGILLWFDKFSFLQILTLPLTIGFMLLWFFFGYLSQLGFMKGIIVGLVGAIPLIFFTLVQAYLLLKGNSVDGTLFGVYNPATVPLMWFYNAFQEWKLDIYLLPYIITPLLVLLCGIASYIGSKTR
jgi:hypothetical protein